MGLPIEFSKGRRPHVFGETFGTPKLFCIATSAGHALLGCSHSVMFRLPCSLNLQVAPTAVATICAAEFPDHTICGFETPLVVPSCKHQPQGTARPFTARNGHAVTYMNCGIITCPNRIIDTTGLSPARLQTCRLLACRSALSGSPTVVK